MIEAHAGPAPANRQRSREWIATTEVARPGPPEDPPSWCAGVGSRWHTEWVSDAQTTQAEDQRAERPDTPERDWRSVGKRTIAEFSADGGTDLAAALTYYAVLSLFPALIAFTSLLGVFGQGPQTTEALLGVARQIGAPDDTLTIVEGFLDSVQGAGGAGLALILGLLGAVFSASNYVNGFSRMMNTVYDVQEGRPIWKLRPWILLLTLVLLLGVVVLALSLVLTGGVARAVGDVVGLGDTAVTVWNIAKWPVMILLAMVLVALLYWGTPNVRPRFRLLTYGAGLALAAAVLGTAGFGFYVANFGSYNATYGALAGVIVLLLWIWLINVTLVLGAELDSELERDVQLRAGKPAEEDLQMEPRDESGVQKKADKHADLVARSRTMRIRANRGGTDS